MCIPTSNGYRIGQYRLEIHKNRITDVYSTHGDLIHSFSDKVSAVLYTIYTIKGKYWISDDILSLDKEINKNYIDIVTMRRCLESAKKRKDYNSVDIRQARLDVSETKLRIATEKIKNIHHTAKINKVWE